MFKTHKIALDPTNTQRTMLLKSAGCARFAYNWALAMWQKMYEEHLADSTSPQPTQLLLRRKLNEIKRKEFPWMLEVTKCAPQEAIINLGRAFTNFFEHRSSYPCFKKKGMHDSFKVSSGAFKVGDNKIRIPRIGWIKMRESLRFVGEVKALTVTRTANRWFASLVVEVSEKAKTQVSSSNTVSIVGVDVGVGEFVTSEGDKVILPKAYKESHARLRRAQKSLSRKQKGSINRRKAASKVAKIHARTANIRSDFLHKYTTTLVKSAHTIVIEDLNVKGMVKNHHLAKAITDASFGEFRHLLEYKCKENDVLLVLANRFYPSSKLCSVCGYKKENMTLAERTWVCPNCNTAHDRDINAAINLREFAESSPVSACGEFFASGTRKYLQIAKRPQ